MARPPVGRIVVAVLFAVTGLNALRQAVPWFGEHEPPSLAAMQALVGITALATAWGSWTGARWASLAAIAWGLAAAILLALVPFVLQLPPEARGGIWAGCAFAMVIAVGTAWYLRHSTTTRS